MPRTNLLLPSDASLGAESIAALSGVFDNRDSSYKFLWTFALLKHIETSDQQIANYDSLCATMLSESIVPINRFKLSFGWHDLVAEHLQSIATNPAFAAQLSQGEFNARAIDSDLVSRVYKQLLAKVPHRWLRPFFAEKLTEKLRGVQGRTESNVREATQTIAARAFAGKNPPPYKLGATGIVLHPIWQSYFKRNMPIIRGWALWHWTNYLQNLNPNIPAIAGKIAFPDSRMQWGDARDFWAMVVGKQKWQCIYSGATLTPRNFHLDHYVPWNFIGHNRPWNLIAVSAHANESKGDKLPHETYFADFAKAHNAAIEIWRQTSSGRFKGVIESYQADLQLTNAQLAQPKAISIALKRTVAPIIETAKNNNFTSDWRYR